MNRWVSRWPAGGASLICETRLNMPYERAVEPARHVAGDEHHRQADPCGRSSESQGLSETVTTSDRGTSAPLAGTYRERERLARDPACRQSPNSSRTAIGSRSRPEWMNVAS